MKPFYHVAVGVVYNVQGEVLLTQRALGKHQGGKWEFAGGKLEPGEKVEDALIREFDEELGIKPTQMQPLISIPYEYPEHSVLLDTWEIFNFEGEPQGREGQAFRWVNPYDLNPAEFPPANRAIIHAIQLPRHYLITSDQPLSLDGLSERIHLCRVRQGQLDDETYAQRVQAAITLGAEHQIKIIVDGFPRGPWVQSAAGWHLNSHELFHYDSRPVSEDTLLFASLHNQEDIIQANKIGVDASVLSPVQPTRSHPEAPPLGWEKFAQLVQYAGHPVYALGGLTPQDFELARQNVGQGVAGITGFR